MRLVCAVVLFLVTVHGAYAGDDASGPTLYSVDLASPALARVYLLEAQKSAAQVQQDFTRKQLLDEIAAALAKTGDYDGALQIVHGIYPSGLEAFKEIGTGMVADDKVAEAKAMARRLPKESHSLLYFVATAQAQAGQVEAAIATANTIDALEVKREAMRNIAAAQVRAGNLSAARETYRNWPEPEPGPSETPAVLADRITAAMAEALVAKDFQAALKMASGVRSPQEKEETYFGIVFALIDTGDTAHAKVALSQLQEVAGHRVSYPMSYVLAKVGLMSEALETARAIQGPDPESSDAQAKALTTIAILRAERGDANAALKTVAEIGTHERKPRPMTEFLRHEALLSVARAQTNAGDSRGAIETVKGVPLSTLADSVLKDAVLFETAYAWAKAGEFSQALAVAKQMHKGQVGLVPCERADAMRTLAAIQAHMGDAVSAALWASSLPEAIDRTAAYLGIAEGLEGKRGLETQEFFLH